MQFSLAAQEPLSQFLDQEVEATQQQAEDEHHDDHDPRHADGFLARRPDHLAQFEARLGEEFAGVAPLAGQHEHADTANQTDHDRQRTQLTRPRTQLGGATGVGGEPEPDEQTGQHQQRCGDILDDISTVGGVVLGVFDLAIHPAVSALAAQAAG
ncbi:hypothetical protein G6F57_012069 [Rhizopus arrhizus]|nr:hypothetical protein G6F57_012069 [Rhizopus arrhizus]